MLPFSAVLAGRLFTLKVLRTLDRAINDLVQLCAACAQRIHGAGFDQAFQYTTIEQTGVHCLAKLEDG